MISTSIRCQLKYQTSKKCELILNCDWYIHILQTSTYKKTDLIYFISEVGAFTMMLMTLKHVPANEENNKQHDKMTTKFIVHNLHSSTVLYCCFVYGVPPIYMQQICIKYWLSTRWMKTCAIHILISSHFRWSPFAPNLSCFKSS